MILDVCHEPCGVIHECIKYVACSVQLTDEHYAHLVKFDDKLYMLSGEVSALLWQKDILHSMVWQLIGSSIIMLMLLLLLC